MDNVSNNLPASISLSQFQNENITDKEYKVIESIFNKIDNSNMDENKNKGVISGENAVKTFYKNLKAQLGEKFNSFMSKIGKNTFNNLDSVIANIKNGFIKNGSQVTYNDGDKQVSATYSNGELVISSEDEDTTYQGVDFNSKEEVENAVMRGDLPAGTFGYYTSEKGAGAPEYYIKQVEPGCGLFGKDGSLIVEYQ